MSSSKSREILVKPYLLRAIYEWVVDQDLTPQVLINATVDGVVVPPNCVNEERIVLTVHPRSVQRLKMTNEDLQFSARFTGKSFLVCIPMSAVLAIYCQENGRGMAFDSAEENLEIKSPKGIVSKKESVAPTQTAKSDRSHLKLVK